MPLAAFILPYSCIVRHSDFRKMIHTLQGQDLNYEVIPRDETTIKTVY